MEALLPFILSLGMVFLVISRVIRLYKNWRNSVFKKQLQSKFDSYKEDQIIHCSVNVVRPSAEVTASSESAPKVKEPSIPECVVIVQKEIDQSRKVLSDSSYMIPLCVSITEKDKVKTLGAVYCEELKTWFWPKGEDIIRRKVVEKWLPKIYCTTKQYPVIKPKLIPRPLWNINLRTLMDKEKWSELSKATAYYSGRRCCICGCKNGDRDLGVECHEQWRYKFLDNESQVGIVYFEGLQTVCTGCHNIYHFGRSTNEGYGNSTKVRFMILNNCSEPEANCSIKEAFGLCRNLSKINQWVFNLDLLEEKYGLKYVYYSEYCPEKRESFHKGLFLELPKFTEYCSILNTQKGCSASNSSGFHG